MLLLSSRCRRELRECVFVPSRRGGRIKKTEPSPAPVDNSTQVLTASSDMAPMPDSPQQQHHVGGPLVSAKIHNPSDALELLVMTAEGRQEGPQSVSSHANQGSTHVSPSDASPHSHHPSPPDPASLAASLEGVPICQQGIVNPEQLRHLLLDVFFPKVHPMFPFISPNRIPKDPAALAVFAFAERHITLAAVIIGSRTEKDEEVHERASAAFEAEVNKLVLGEVPTLGSIEALLLLSEHIPKQKTEYDSEIQRMRQEERVACKLVYVSDTVGAFV